MILTVKPKKDSVKIEKHQTRMVAHRGLSGIETENTAAAFVAAGNRSYFGIETDVHRTLDGRFVVFHDDTTGRVCVDDMVVEKTTYECLRSLRILDAEGKKDRWDLRIPDLTEYISICKCYGKVAVLELKNSFTREDIYRIIEIIDDMDYLENVIFISFDFDNLLYVRERSPLQFVQYLVEEFSEELIEKLKKHKMDVDIEYSVLDEEKICAFHKAGITVNCWTCDDPAFAESLAAWGIDMISTNILE